MNAVFGGCAVLALVLIVLAAPASAQDKAEGWVELEFLETEVSLGPDDEVIIPLKVEAEIECVTLQGPPSHGVPILGQSGVAYSTGDRYYYTTEVEPEELPFRHAGSDRYVVDETVALTVRTDFPVEEPTNNTVAYSTVSTGSNQGCNINGWSLPSAESTSFVAHLVPPDPDAVESVQESSGVPSLIAISAVIGSIGFMFVRRLQAK